MIARRDILALGAGALMLPALPAFARTARPTGLVLDTRFPATRAIQPPPSGWTHRIDGDVTGLWYDRLDQAWRDQAAGPVMGITGSDALFVLEHLAWDRQRRVVLRQTMPQADGPVPLMRWLIAPHRA